MKRNGNKMIRKGVRLDQSKIIMNSVFPLGMDVNDVLKFTTQMFRNNLLRFMVYMSGIFEEK